MQIHGISFLQNFITIPACPIYSYLGFPCPACGMTRATYALVNGDFFSSIGYNPTILYFAFVTPIYLFIQFFHGFSIYSLNVYGTGSSFNNGFWITSDSG